MTGHHHRIEDHAPTCTIGLAAADEIVEAAIARANLWRAPSGERFLEVKEAVTLRHEEHTEHTIPPGIYQVPQQVEYTPSERGLV